MEDKIVNLGGTIENFPKTPIVPDVPSGVPGENVSFDEMFAKGMKSVPSGGKEAIPVSSFYTDGTRYAETRPGTDYEEMHAQLQPTWDKWRNGIGKMVGVAATSFVSGTAGLIYGAGSALINMKLSNLINNPITQGMNTAVEKMEDYLPNYESRQEKDADWHSMDNILTANFWSNKVIKNLGYSIGAIGGGVAWSSLFKAIGVTNKLVQAGYGLETADAIETAMAAAPKTQKFAAFQTALNNSASKYLQGKGGAILKDSDRILTSVMGTFGEAAMEGLQNMNDFRKNAIESYKEENGYLPTGQDLDDINNASERIGMYTWGFNTILLSGTNYIVLPKILGSSRRFDKALINRVEQEGIAKPFEKAAARFPFEKQLKGVTSLAGLAFSPTEAFEEGSQFAIQTGVDGYFNRAYDNQEETGDFLSTLSETMGNIVTEGVYKTLNTKEGLENILIGGISGGLQQAGYVGRYQDESGKTKFGIGKSGELGQRGLFGEGGEKKFNTQTALTALNKTNIDKSLKDMVGFMARAVGSQKLRQQAIVENDVLAEKDYEQDFMLSYVMPRVKYGKTDSIYRELDYYASQASTEQGFNELKTSIVAENETREQFLDRINNLKETTKKVDKLYDSLNDKYGNISKDGERLYSDDVIDKMVYASAKVIDYSNRIPQISAKLSSVGVLADTVIEDISKGQVESFKKAVDDINSKTEITSTEKEEQIGLLQDAARLTILRNKFVNEYNDIRINPAKYAPPKPVKETKTPEGKAEKAVKIKIKTEKGEQTFETGKEYFVGTGVDFRKDSLDTYIPFALFTIVGETADGKIQIKDKNGNLKDISKQNFLDLRVNDSSLLQKDEGAKFYYTHRNKQFEFNFGKDRGGKVPGRLFYENGNVYFVYKDAKGQIKRKVINRTHLEKQAPYKEAVLTKVGTIKATQEEQEAWDSFTSLQSLQRQKETLAKTREQRLEVISEIEKETREELERITKTIESKQKLLTDTQSKLKELQDKIKPNTAKKTLGAINSSIKQLGELEKSTQQEIDTLNKTKENLEMDISYFEAYKEDLDDSPENMGDFLNELNDQLEELNNLEKQTSETLDNLSSLHKQVVESIKATLASLRDVLSKNNPEYLPDVDSAIDAINEGGDVLAQLAKVKQTLTDYAITEDMSNALKANEDKFAEVNDEIEKTKQEIEKLRGTISVSKKVLDKFKEMYEQLIKEEEAMAQIIANEKIIEEAIGTAYKGVQILNPDKTYEANPRKAKEIIPRATIGIDEGKPHQERANRFGFNLENLPNRDDIRGVYVTFTNQDQILPGLTARLATTPQGAPNPDIDQKGIIALVMVNDKGDLVDENGEVIPEDATDKLDRAIYQVYPGEKLQWSTKHGEESMFRAGTDDNIVKSITEQYVKWRRATLKNPPDLSKKLASDRHTIESSFGIVDYTEDGSKTSAVSTGLVTERQLEKTVVIKIPTTNNTIAKGTVAYDTPYGIAFLETDNGYVKLHNRKHTKEEAETIFKVLVQLAKNMLDENIGIKHRKSELLYEWLKSVVYWGVPKDINGNLKSLGYNSIFWEKDEFTSRFMLSMSGKGKDFVFTPESLMQNKALIIGMLQEMYNNINNSKLKEIEKNYKKTDDSEGVYEQIIDVKEDGTVETVTWPSYQSYLLSETNPDGTKRDPETLPLATTVRALDKDNPKDVNRKAIYFYTKDTADDYTIPEVTTKTNSKSVLKGFKKKDTKKGGKKKVLKKATPKKTSVFGAAKGKAKRYGLNGKIINYLTFPSGLTIRFRASNKVTKDTIKKFIKFEDDPKTGDMKKMLDSISKMPKHKNDDPLEVLRGLIYEVIKKQAERDAAEERDATEEKGGGLVNYGKQENYDPEEEEGTDEENADDVIDDTDDDQSVDETQDDETQDDDEGEEVIIGKIQDKLNANDEKLREAIIDEAEGYEVEDWNKVEAWIKKVLPNIPIYRLKNIIDATNGRKAFGMFKNGAIYIYENAEVGTAYHEVFHAVWNIITSPEERASILKELSQREGTFLDRKSMKDVKYSEASPKQLEELLAEEFRDYVQYKKIPAKPKTGRPFVVKLFADLVRLVKEFFLGPQAATTTEQLFKKIGRGDYSGYNQFEESLSYATKGIMDIEGAEIDDTADYSLVGITDKQRSEMVEHMTFVVMNDIIQNDKNLFAISDLNKVDLYPRLKRNLINTLQRKIEVIQLAMDEGQISETKGNAMLQKETLLVAHTDLQFDEIFAKFEEYLRGYHVEFDENDNLELTNEDRTKGTDWVDGDKIDHFKKSPIAIKMLLATIPETDEQGLPKVSSIGGRRLLPLSQVYINVMNNVHDAVSIEDMMDKLRTMALGDPDYVTVYERLTKRSILEEGISFDNINNKYAAQLLGAFWKTFKKQNPEVKNVFILENGDVVIGDAALSTAARQIQEDFENAITAKIQGGKSFFIYDAKKKKYTADPDKLKKEVPKLATPLEYSKFLKLLGIDFTESEINNMDNLKVFKEAVDGIWFSMRNLDEIASVNGKILDIRGRLLELATIRASLDNPQFNSTYFNVTGERTQSYIGVNMASALRSFLSSLDKFTDQTVQGTQYEYLKTDSFARNANVLQRKYDRDGNLRKGAKDLLSIGYVGGMINQKTGKQKQSSKLSYIERFIQEINLNLAGWYLNLVPGDASMEWMINMGKALDTDITRGTKLSDIFRGFFIDELQLTRETDRNIAEGRDRNEMRFFKEILGEKLHKDVTEEPGTPESVYKLYKNRIDAAVLKYVMGQKETLKNNLISYNILKMNENKEWNAEGINLPSDMSNDQLDNALELLTANYIIANIDLHKILYSDPYQYEDELKRIKNFLSPRQVLMGNSKEMNATLDRVWNENINEDSSARTDFTRDYFRSITYSDVSGVINIPKYGKYKETDGAGIISYKAYRNFRIRSSEWNDAEERQYKYDMAWEDVQNGIELSDEMMEIYLAGNPKVRSAYTPIKPIVGGNKFNGEPYNDMILDKFALYPLSRRLMADLNIAGDQASSNTIKLYDKMKREDIDYVVFKSSRKVGPGVLNSPYNDKGEFNETPYDGIINIPFENISVQSEVPSKDVYEVTRGSQVTKLVTMDFMEAGVPVDFMPGKPFPERYKAWFDPKNDKTQSAIYREIKHNQDLLSALMEQGYQSLLRRLGIKETTKTIAREEENVFGGIDRVEEIVHGYEIADFSQVVSTLREEILKREVSENITDALTGFENGKVVLEATPAYQQIRNILYSIADKEVVSPKMNGGMKVQIPSTFMEETRTSLTEINGKQGYTSEVLKLYEEDGENVCEIMISRWFESPMSDAKLMEYLNTTDEGKRILSGISFRTPTQKQNSIDRFKVVRFLPTEFGDSIVVPAAFVEKTGSDFDIDKLSIYLKHVVGKKFPKMVKYLTDTNSTAEQRYYNWVVANANKDTSKYIRHLAKDEIAALRKEFNQRYEEISSNYTEARSEIQQEEYEELTQSYKESLEEAYSFQDVEMKRLFKEGSKPYWSLSDNIRVDFEKMKKYIADKGISGAAEIQNYRNVAIVARNFPETTEDDIKHLNAMIDLYDQELRILGATEEEVKESKAAAYARFKLNKITRLSEIGDIASDERETIRTEKEEFNFNYATELAEMSELMSFDKFKTLPEEKQNTRKALENEFIESGERLISDQHNRERLLSPNSSKMLSDLAADVASKTVGKSFDYKNVGNMMNREFMSKLRHAFVTGKYAIGIAAVNQTNHSLNQRQPIYIDPRRLDKVSKEDQFWLRDGDVKFAKVNRIEVDGEMLPTLSMIRSNDNEHDISDILSQFIDGYVDISKGPWIMELGATPNVASTYMFLVKLGVPIKDVVYFMNQPIIRKYLQSIENDGYSWLFMDSYVKAMQEEDETFKVENAELKLAGIKQIPDTTRLYSNLDKKTFNEKERIEQQYILREFLKYAKMANHLFLITQGSNFDTANLNDPALIYKKLKQLEKAQQTLISSVDDMMENSFIGDLSTTIQKMREALAEIIRSDKTKVRTVIQQVLEPYIDIKDRDFAKMAQKATNDLFDWLVQTNPQTKDGIYLNDMIREILIKDGGVAREVMDYIEKEKIKTNKKHPLHNNYIIKIITQQPSDRASKKGANNLIVKGMDNKIYDQNNIIYAFRELRDVLNARGEGGLYERMKMLAVLQSGLSTSKISFTSLLPYEDFEDVYNDILANINNYSLTQFVKLGVFQRNNWNNDDIVPWKRAALIKVKDEHVYNPSMAYLPRTVKNAVKTKEIPPVLSQSVNNREANYDYIVYTWELQDEILTAADVERMHKMKIYSKIDKIKQKKQEMRKAGDYSFIQKGLFKKVYDEYGEPFTYNSAGKDYFVFKAINGWGEGTKANEFYTDDRMSVIDNGLLKIKVKENEKDKTNPNFIGVDSDEDTNVIDLFIGKNADKKNKSVNFETGEDVPTKTLMDGEIYTYDEINSKMLEDMGYSPEEIGEILKSIC